METDSIKKFILKLPFFKVFNDNELNKLVGRDKVFKDCPKDGYIFKEGFLWVQVNKKLTHLIELILTVFLLLIL